MSKRKKTYSFLLLVAAFAVSGYFLLPHFSADASVSRADSGREEKTDEEPSIAVEVAIARLGSISSAVSSTANLKAKREVTPAVQAEGVVREIGAEEGDFVQEGQLLCRLDDTQLKIRLQSSRQKLAQARLQLEKAKILQEKSDVQVGNTREEYDRYRSLFQEQLVSEREVAQVKYRLDELEHDLRASSSASRELIHRVEELQAEIEQVELEIARTRVEAPFAGLITRRSVEVGQTVRNLDALFTLADFSPLEADVFLSERDAAMAKIGQGVTVYSGVDSETATLGRVARISPVVDGATGTVKVTVELAGESRLFKPGAFVRVEIRTDMRTGSTLIPKRAILEEDGESFVFLAREESVERVLIEVGFQHGGDVEILSGVAVGDSVVVAGQGGLKEGSKIRLVERTA